MVKFSKTKILNTMEWLAGHVFLTFLLIFLISLIFGVVTFYKYSILAEQAEPIPEVVPVQFKEDLYQEVIEERGLRKEKFESVEYKEDFNPFWID